MPKRDPITEIRSTVEFFMAHLEKAVKDDQEVQIVSSRGSRQIGYNANGWPIREEDGSAILTIAIGSLKEQSPGQARGASATDECQTGEEAKTVPLLRDLADAHDAG